MSRARRLAAAGGILLMLAYVVPLFAPPAAPWPLEPAADAGLFERMFPGVPTGWVLGRLLCLFGGAWVVVLSLRLPLGVRLGRRATIVAGEEDRLSTPFRGSLGVAFLLALAHAVSGFYAERFGRAVEISYLLFLGVPAAVLAAAERDLMRRLLRWLRSCSATLLPVPGLWLLWSIPTAWRSPRAASIVDGWLAVQRFEEVVLGHQRVLADSAIPGFSNAYMMLEGVPFFGPSELAKIFATLQLAHLFWTPVCAVAIGLLVWALVGGEAAVIAEAVFLFSPFSLSCPYNPLPIYLMPLCTVTLLLLFLGVYREGSLAALAAFGAVAGFTAPIPQHSLPTALLCVLVLAWFVRLRRRPWLGLTVAVFSGSAAILPALPSIEGIRSMVEQFTGGQGQYVGFEAIL